MQTALSDQVSTENRNLVSFEALKADFIRRNRRGIAFIGAATATWILYAILGVALPENLRPYIYLYGSGIMFPSGILAATLLKHDWQSKGNPFGLMGGLVGGLQLLFAPIVIMAWAKQPELLPFYLGVVVGAHLLPFVWLYDSKTYLFLAIGITLAAAATGALFPEMAYTLTPLSIACVLLVGTLRLHSENRTRTGSK